MGGVEVRGRGVAAGEGIPNPFWEEVSRDDTVPHAITDTVKGSQLQISLHHLSLVS